MIRWSSWACAHAVVLLDAVRHSAAVRIGEVETTFMNVPLPGGRPLSRSGGVMSVYFVLHSYLRTHALRANTAAANSME